MQTQPETKQKESKERPLKYVIAFAFGLGVALGSAVSSWITTMLKP